LDNAWQILNPYSVQTQDKLGQCLANPKPILCTETGKTCTMPGKHWKQECRSRCNIGALHDPPELAHDDHCYPCDCFVYTLFTFPPFLLFYVERGIPNLKRIAQQYVTIVNKVCPSNSVTALRLILMVAQSSAAGIAATI